MKGTAITVLAIALAVYFFILLPVQFTFFPRLRSGEVSDILVRTRTFSLFQALDGAEVYASTALAYAGDQGCFDVLAAGGEVTDPPAIRVWWDNGPKSLALNDIQTQIARQTEDHFTGYLSRRPHFLDVILPFPQYTVRAEGETVVSTPAAPLFLAERPYEDVSVAVGRTIRSVYSLPGPCLALPQAAEPIAFDAGKRLDAATTNWKDEAAGTLPQAGTASFSLPVAVPPETNQRKLGSLVLESATGNTLAVWEENLRGHLQEGIKEISPIGVPEGLTGKLQPLATSVSIDPSCNGESVPEEGGTKKLTIACEFPFSGTALLRLELADPSSKVAVAVGGQVKKAPLAVVALLRSTAERG